MESANITQLLKAYSSGEKEAFDKLFSLVYDKLHQIAHHRMYGEQVGHTLNTTGLVHNAYLKLLQFNCLDWQDRNHFFAIASQVMRNILVDYAVSKKAKKRGGELDRITMGDNHGATEVNVHELLSIHQSLEKLAAFDEQQVRVVECRFFGGLTIEETSKALDISTATVSRDWKIAKAWLSRELSE